MKKYILLLLLPFILSCTNYYSVTLLDETPVYLSKNENGGAITVVPKDEQVYITKSGKYRKIKYKDYSGWAVNPNYSGATSSSSYTSKISSSKGSSYSSSKTVHVKGYTRKDGTYVKPHTRSAPKRH